MFSQLSHIRQITAELIKSTNEDKKHTISLVSRSSGSNTISTKEKMVHISNIIRYNNYIMLKSWLYLECWQLRTVYFIIMNYYKKLLYHLYQYIMSCISYNLQKNQRYPQYHLYLHLGIHLMECCHHYSQYMYLLHDVPSSV